MFRHNVLSDCLSHVGEQDQLRRGRVLQGPEVLHAWCAVAAQAGIASGSRKQCLMWQENGGFVCLHIHPQLHVHM